MKLKIGQIKKLNGKFQLIQTGSLEKLYELCSLPFIEHLFGKHTWEYDDFADLRQRHCVYCHYVEYPADYMDILGNNPKD